MSASAGQANCRCWRCGARYLVGSWRVRLDEAKEVERFGAMGPAWRYADHEACKGRQEDGAD